MKRLAMIPVLVVLLVIAALLAVVDVFSKARAAVLARVRSTSRLTRFGLAAAAGGVLILTGLVPWESLSLLGVALGAVKTEGQHAGEFILGEAESKRSRETITVLSGQNLKAGAVVGKVAIGVGKAAIPAVVGTGNGTMTALYAGPEVEKGDYVVKCITAAANGGTFSVTAPSGKLLPNATVGTDYRSRHINFKINDGATDFIVNDTFTITVTTGAPTVVGTGNGTISGLSLGPDAKTGQYLVECIEAITNGGAFKVVSPDGDEIAVGYIVAGAGGTLVLADQRQLNLTITDGATDFAVGDKFQVFVFNELTKKCVAWDPLTFDGRHKALGVLYDNVDATSADLAGVIITRDAVVSKSDLQWAAAITAAQKESAYLDLASRGVIAR